MSFTIKKTKALDCKECGEEVKNVGMNAVEVICWRCVAKSLNRGLDCLDDTTTDEVSPTDEK